MASTPSSVKRRKDSSIDMLRTKIAHKKSLSQKANRHATYENKRHLGLKDVNIPTLEGRTLELDETSQELVSGEISVKPRSLKSLPSDQHRQMLQKYKEEKQLKKLKEQREKAKRGVFKVGLYRPDKPVFLHSIIQQPKKIGDRSDVQATQSGQRQTSEKKEGDETKAVQSAAPMSVRMTRSVTAGAKQTAGAASSSAAKPVTRVTRDNETQRRAPNQGRSVKKIEEKRGEIGDRSDVQATQSGQRQTSEKKEGDETKAVQSAAPMSVRMTRSVTAGAKQTAGAASSSAAKPVTRVTRDNETQRRAPNQGRSLKKIEEQPGEGISFKADSQENTLESQTSSTTGVDPDRVFSKMEKLPKTNTAKMKGRQSFAPEDFVFHPPYGLRTYGLISVTPRSRNSLTLSDTWNPLKAEIDKTQESANEILAQKCKTFSAQTVHQGSNKLQCPSGSLTVGNTEYVLNRNETTTDFDGLPIKEVPSLDINEDQKSQSQHNMQYFRNILWSETEELMSYCLEWDRKLALDIPDEVKGLVRVALGQTRLLVHGKFRQFAGLVDDCEYKRSEKDITCTDLEGFWDVVSLQIHAIRQKFNKLTKLEERGWKDKDNTSRKVSQEKVASGIASKPKQDDGGRSEARKCLAPVKKVMRDKSQREEHGEAAASVMSKEVDKIVFDGGFFRIESPVKSFSATPGVQ